MQILNDLDKILAEKNRQIISHCIKIGILKSDIGSDLMHDVAYNIESELNKYNWGQEWTL